MASRFWVNTAGGTWDSATTSNWSTTTGGATGASVPGSADTAIFDGNSGANTITNNYAASLTAVTLNTGFAGTLSLGNALTTSGNITLINGAFVTNSNPLTCAAFISSSGTGRTADLGASTINLTSTATTTVWNVTNSQATFVSQNANIVISTASTNTRTFAGSLPYASLTYTVASSPGLLAITGANTFGMIMVNSDKQIQFPSSTTNTVTNFNVNGTNNGFLYQPGVSANYASTPDSAALSITGDLDLRVDVALDTLTPPATQYIIAKDDVSTGRSYSLRLLTNGGLNFVNSLNGSAVSSRNSTTQLPLVGYINGQRLTVRVTYRNSDGRIMFWTGTGGVNGTFTQLGVNTTATILGIFDSTSELAIGATSGGSGPLPGQYYRAQVRNNILDDGTGIVFDANFTTKPFGANSFAESSSNATTVTINGVLAQAGDGRVAITSSTAGTAATVSSSSLVNLDYVTVQDNTAAGTTPFYAGAHGVLVSGTTNWLATAAPSGSGTMLLMGIGS